MSNLGVFAAGHATAGQMCAICQTQIVVGEQIVNCSECALPFHHECWTENGGCAQYGCKNAPQTVKAGPATVASAVWGEEKPCPSCRKLIKAQAVKCRFCGAAFDSAEIISADAYATREYEGQQYTGARNKVVAMFLASVTGCLSPVSATTLGILILRKRFWGIEFRRLPAAIRTLAFIGWGLSGLFILLFILFVAFD